MIVGDRINKIDADIAPGAYEGFKIDIKMGDAKKEAKDRMTINYIYTVDYGKMGKLSLYGTVVEGDEKIIASYDEKTKRFPTEYTEKLVNVINFLGSAHGTVVSRVLNVRPPIIAPTLSVKSEAPTAKPVAKK